MRRPLPLVVAAGLCAVSLGLGGCTVEKNVLGPKESICFSAIPVARTLVGKKAVFAGVRYLGPRSLVGSIERAEHHHLMPPAMLRQMGRHAACLVAYRGRLSPRSLATGWRPGRGPYRFAIVVIRLRDHRLLGVVLLRRPPLGFADLL